jgi:hypothetical protein
MSVTCSFFVVIQPSVCLPLSLSVTTNFFATCDRCDSCPIWRLRLTMISRERFHSRQFLLLHFRFEVFSRSRCYYALFLPHSVCMYIYALRSASDNRLHSTVHQVGFIRCFLWFVSYVWDGWYWFKYLFVNCICYLCVEISVNLICRVVICTMCCQEFLRNVRSLHVWYQFSAFEFVV